MKVLITGSAGFVGTHLIRLITAYGGVEVMKCDAKEGSHFQDLYDQLKGIDTVVHLAAFIDGEASWKEQEAYMDNNALDTYQFAKRCMHRGVSRFIFASSAAVYGNPLSPYGASKKASETLLQGLTVGSQMQVYLPRFFNIYGKGQNRAYAGAIHKFYEAISKGEPITIYGDGYQCRDFVFVDDVCEVIWKLMTSEFPARKGFDVGTGFGLSINRLASMMMDRMGKRVKIEHAPSREEIKMSRANGNMFLDMLGVRMRPFSDGLLDYLNSLK